MKALVIARCLAASAASAQPAANPCAAPERRQFDFWVGRWEVSPTGQTASVADSLIESAFGGCAIRETWMPKGQVAGGSLSAYVPETGRWRQAWVDRSGAWVEFEGGWDGRTMELTGRWPEPDKPTRVVRMRYTAGTDGTVRQLGEESVDGGKTWTPGFDFTYRRKAS